MSAEDVAAELEEGRSRAYFADILQREDRTVLVAEDEGVLLGYVQFGSVNIAEVDAQRGDQAVHRLYVETAVQGQGIGRRLSQAALEHPRLAEATRVFLQVWDRNERAVRLYTSLGFKRIGTTRLTVGSHEGSAGSPRGRRPRSPQYVK